jgi:lipopolysaccharide biosynthesis glycosyltransferase
MSNLRLPAVVHFVSDGKPWKIIAMEYLNLTIPSTTLIELKKQEYVHIFWRIEFFKATGDIPPQRSSFGEQADELFRSLLENMSVGGKSKDQGKKGKRKNYIEKLDIFFEKNQRYQEEDMRLKKEQEREELAKKTEAPQVKRKLKQTRSKGQGGRRSERPPARAATAKHSKRRVKRRRDSNTGDDQL